MRHRKLATGQPDEDTQISRIQRDLRSAYNQFNYTRDQDLIEASILEIRSLQAQYNHLLRQIRQKARDST